MSQENVKLIYRGFDTFNRRDLGTYLALTDEDVEAIPRMGAMEVRLSRPRRHPSLVDRLARRFPDFSVEFHEAHDMGGT